MVAGDPFSFEGMGCRPLRLPRIHTNTPVQYAGIQPHGDQLFRRAFEFSELFARVILNFSLVVFVLCSCTALGRQRSEAGWPLLLGENGWA